MIKKIKKTWRFLTDMEEWKIRLFGLKKAGRFHGRRGLILVQIDGLSYGNLKRAMGRKYMPFLHRLIRRERYHLHRMFSGVPSNTPAFQGEFFFGQFQCVPAFQYRERADGTTRTMFEKKSAHAVESEMARHSDGLLSGGTAYGNIFSGGAAESHLCVSSAELATILKTWNPYSLLISILLSPLAVVRGILLCFAEMALSFLDFLRGCVSGQDVLEELKFILTRVTVSILFREVVTSHARLDIYRGMPVIHVNYFGYDEQAHRRGPSTRYAYWSLRGIDSAIRTLWFAGLHARRRHYDVWVYSDHGQEKVSPFSKETGKHIRDAVQELYDEMYPEPGEQTASVNGRQKSWGDSVLGFRSPREPHTPENKPVVTTLGPISQIYFPRELTESEKRDFAGRLLQKYPVLPVAALPHTKGDADLLTGIGTLRLPEDKEKLLGESHPYLEAVTQDLRSLLQHENCGDLVLFGWRAGMPAITFSNENGAHAGFGPHETQAFALLPADVPVQKEGDVWFRGIQLREAALVALGRKKRQSRVRRSFYEAAAAETPESEKLRIMSYNVHSCVGLDGILSVERVARVIARSAPDIVALQELDAGRKNKGIHQASDIARELEMHFHFHAVMGAELESFGNAILSRYPMRLVRSEHLPTLGRPSSMLEPRGLLWVEIDYQGRLIQILNTHLSLWRPEQRIQIAELIRAIQDDPAAADMILCGDFNLTPGSAFYQMLCRHFDEPGRNSRYGWNTWTSQWPIRRLDHILTRGSLQAHIVPLARTRLEQYASDHLPTVADVELLPVEEKTPAAQTA